MTCLMKIGTMSHRNIKKIEKKKTTFINASPIRKVNLESETHYAVVKRVREVIDSFLVVFLVGVLIYHQFVVYRDNKVLKMLYQQINYQYNEPLLT